MMGWVKKPLELVFLFSTVVKLFKSQVDVEACASDTIVDKRTLSQLLSSPVQIFF